MPRHCEKHRCADVLGSQADLNGEAKETQIRSVNVQLMTQQAELERAYNDQTNIMVRGLT